MFLIVDEEKFIPVSVDHFTHRLTFARYSFFNATSYKSKPKV
jgi:hypothetical protein